MKKVSNSKGSQGTARIANPRVRGSRTLGTKAAAAYLGISAGRLRAEAVAGRIEVVIPYDGANWAFEVGNLEQWITDSKRRIV